MLRVFLLLLSLSLAGAAEAQYVYRWVDDQGEVHYGHSVPPEYKDYGYEKLGPDGTVIESVEPALSPEEIAEQRRKRAEQAEREAEQRRRETRDRMLLATYNSEEALEETLEMQLAGIESQRQSTRKAVELVEKRFENLVGRAARITREGGTVSESLDQSIEETRSELRRLRRELERLDQREENTRQRFMADLERYRELTDSADEGSG